MPDLLREQKNRTLWKCRQGTRELELVLCGYAQSHYDSLSQQQRQLFDQLLDFSNAELNDWLLLGAQTYDECFTELIENIRSHKTHTNHF